MLSFKKNEHRHECEEHIVTLLFDDSIEIKSTWLGNFTLQAFKTTFW